MTQISGPFRSLPRALGALFRGRLTVFVAEARAYIFFDLQSVE